MRALMATALFLIALALGSASVAAWVWFTVPLSTAKTQQEVEIKEGQNITQVAQELEKHGLLRWPKVFVWYARMQNKDHSLKAGSYTFEGELLPDQILAKLVKGQVDQVSFSLPEGLNVLEVAARLSEVFPSIPKAEWLKTFKNPLLLQKMGLKKGDLEGYLYPDTYTIRKKASAYEVVFMLVKNFQKNLTPDILEKAKAKGLTPHQLVTLASIIEKETGRPQERPLISAVFHNRLKKGMRLQTDPTVIYGIKETFDGNLRRRDLLTPHPYNTYVIFGLPPGPIANPGRDSLLAAVEPAAADYLYFVAKGDGSSAYSSRLEDHNKNVYQFQIAPYQKSKK